ncbi:MAG: cell division protein FtsZ [SAR202 cluster bacterium]|nr:cell division protein FtsZ [SAR202 cluster bacterium]
MVEDKNEIIGQAKVAVIGVGGGGSNAVNRMYRNKIPHIQYATINTDAQALSNSDVPSKLRVGDRLARGMGVGGNPEKGRLCHEEDREHILELVDGQDMVFIAAGMGGGTGTGGAPVVASVAKEAGALTVGVVTKPFAFEGSQRTKQATEGVASLEQQCDTLIVVPNDRLLLASETNISMDMAFRRADDVLRQGVQSIAELILVPGEINLDFADVTTIMKNAGPAWMAIGTGKGEDKAIEAAEMAISSPLLEQTIDGAKGVLFNITGGSDLSINEIEQASQTISSVVDPDANIIFGTVTDERLNNEMRITLIGTGFPTLNGSYKSEKTESNRPSINRSNTSQESSNSNNQNDLDIPPFLRK